MTTPPASPDEEVLPALVRAARGQWLPGLLVALAVLAASAAWVGSLPDRYTSTTVVSFAPRVDRPSGADTLQVLASKYVAYLSSPATLRAVGESTGEDPLLLQEAVRAEIAPATVNLTVAATLEDPSRAASVANAFAAAAAAESIDDANLRAEVLTPAVEPLGPSGPPRALLLAVGAAVAAGAGLLVAVVLSALRGAATRRPATARTRRALRGAAPADGRPVEPGAPAPRRRGA